MKSGISTTLRITEPPGGNFHDQVRAGIAYCLDMVKTVLDRGIGNHVGFVQGGCCEAILRLQLRAVVQRTGDMLDLPVETILLAGLFTGNPFDSPPCSTCYLAKSEGIVIDCRGNDMTFYGMVRAISWPVMARPW